MPVTIAPGTPQWPLAAVVKDPSGINLTSVPYTISSPLLLTTNGFRNLFVYTDLTGAKRSVWLEVDSDVPSSTGDYNIASFTGKILLFDLNNNFLFGQRYTNGVKAAIIVCGTAAQNSQYMSTEPKDNLLGFKNKLMPSGAGNLKQNSSKHAKESVTAGAWNCESYDVYNRTGYIDAVTGIEYQSFPSSFQYTVTKCTTSLFFPDGAPPVPFSNFGGIDGFGSVHPHSLGGGGVSPLPIKPVYTGFVKGSAGILDQTIKDDKFWLIPCKTLANYKSLATFLPPKTVTDRIESLSKFEAGLSVQSLKNADGRQINMDYFAVNIKNLPTVAGTQWSADLLLKYIRTNMNNFLDNRIATFDPYVSPSIDDTQLYNSSNCER